MKVDNVKTAFRLPSGVNEDFTGIWYGSANNNNSLKKVSTSKKKISTNSSQKVFQKFLKKRPVPTCQVFSLQPYQKKDIPRQVFSCEIIKNTFFVEQLRTTVSGRAQDLTKKGPNSNSQWYF